MTFCLSRERQYILSSRLIFAIESNEKVIVVSVNFRVDSNMKKERPALEWHHLHLKVTQQSHLFCRVIIQTDMS
jgi:hypothetical protein